jgi:hypothetical protein
MRTLQELKKKELLPAFAKKNNDNQNEPDAERIRRIAYKTEGKKQSP